MTKTKIPQCTTTLGCVADSAHYIGCPGNPGWYQSGVATDHRNEHHVMKEKVGCPLCRRRAARRFSAR